MLAAMSPGAFLSGNPEAYGSAALVSVGWARPGSHAVLSSSSDSASCPGKAEEVVETTLATAD